MRLRTSWAACFGNPFKDHHQLSDAVKDQLGYLRPVFFGMATKNEVQRMDSKELNVLNEAIIQLEDEQAVANANRIADVIAPMLGIKPDDS